MSAEQVPDVATERDMAKTIAYMALGVAAVAVVLLGVYVYRSMKPMPIIEKLQKSQETMAGEVKDIERTVKDLNINIAAIEQTIRRDRQAATVLDLKRSLITIQEVRKQAPESLRPKIEVLEEQLGHLLDEVTNASPKKRIEIRSVR